jgi:hypothetical protein
MRAMLMSGVIRRHVHVSHVHVMVAGRHRHGGCQGNRQVEIANDERQSAIDRRQHEAGGYQAAQKHEAEDEQSGPAWFPNATCFYLHRGLVY